MASTNAGDLNIFQNGTSQPNTIKLQTTNLDIPLLVGFNFLSRFRILAGPVASIKLAENKDFAQKIASVTSDAGTAFANAAYGYQAGVGVHLLGLDIDLRKTGSISNISSVQFVNNNGLNQKFSAWQLTAAIKIL